MPPRRKPNRARDQLTAVLEDMRDKFDLVLEATRPIPQMKKKLDATLEETGHLRTDMEIVKAALKLLGRDLDYLKKDVGVLKRDVGVLKDDMKSVKLELRLIRNELKEKVGRDEFVALEERVIRLEETAQR